MGTKIYFKMITTFKKNIFAVLFLTVLIFNCSAQRFEGGLLAGMSAGQIDGDTQFGYKKPGFYAGVSVETQLNALVGIKSELFYTGKGAVKNVDGYEEFRTTLHYVELPFYLTIKPLKQFQMDLGLAFAYLISSKLRNLGQVVGIDLYDMHKTEFSGIASATYFFTEKAGFNFRFNYSLLPVKNNPNWFNNCIFLGAVYKIK